MELAWSRIALRLTHPFRTATALRTEKETIWIRLRHEGIEGWGEAVPVDTYGQTLESAEVVLPSIAERLRSANPSFVDSLVQMLVSEFGAQRAAIAAVDAALHDWLGKRLNLPVCHLLGLDPAQAPPTSFTIGIDSLDSIAGKVTEAAEYPILKVKLGTPHDAQILDTVRRHAPHKRLRVDANTAWSARDMPQHVSLLQRSNVELLEQPVTRDDLSSLGEFKSAMPIPIVADESCVTPNDVARVAPFVGGINIKLSKCGGIREALRMIHIARGLGLKVMLGCMIESSLGISAAAQLAPLVDWVDLDGHLLLADDPFTGLGGNGGRLRIGAMPGLGVVRKSGKSA